MKYIFFVIIDWADEAVEKAEILRLIYQGRFLHSNVTLGALGLVPARTTVMHLVPRETLPEPNSQGENYDRTTSGCDSDAIRIFTRGSKFGTPLIAPKVLWSYNTFSSNP